MPEENVFFNSGSLSLEGLLFKAADERGVVICHPHSLMGGSMHNNVVETIQEVFAAENVTTLRFNFRGVGKSAGEYSDGNGEQDDINSAYQFLKKLGCREVIFAGYSFGAWVGTKLLARENPFSLNILISPPINYLPFNYSGLKGKINLVICGDRDQFCSPESLLSMAEEVKAKAVIVSSADHFYSGKESILKNHLQNYIKNEK